MDKNSGDFLLENSKIFNVFIEKIKKDINPSFPWYPYGALNNFIHLRALFNKFPIDSLIKEKNILDIGAADGDLAFYLESLDYKVDIVDFGPTNFNNLEGAKLIKNKIKSNVEIYETDLDSQFSLPGKKYDLIFFLGILYHLKNPFYALEALSKKTEFLILSTRIAKYTNDGSDMSKYPLAYLVGEKECNNDSTNYWIFSLEGFKRILQRTHWNILHLETFGDTVNSNPSMSENDERVFVLLKSQNFN